MILSIAVPKIITYDTTIPMIKKNYNKKITKSVNNDHYFNNNFASLLKAQNTNFPIISLLR